MKKHLIWASAALVTMACMSACDESSSSAKNSIPEYKNEAALPDSCDMEVAKVSEAYYACYHDKWIEVTDSTIIEKIENGLDEDELKETLDSLVAKLSSSSTKPTSSSSEEEDEEEDDGEEEVDSDDEEENSTDGEECRGKRCGGDGSSSGKDKTNPSGENSSSSEGGTTTDEENSSSSEGGTSIDEGDSSSSEGGTGIDEGDSSSSEGGTGIDEGDSSSSVSGDSGSSDSGSGEGGSSGSVEQACLVTYDPATHYCKDGVVKAWAISVEKTSQYGIFVPSDSSTAELSVEDAESCEFSYTGNLAVNVTYTPGSCTFTVVKNNLAVTRRPPLNFKVNLTSVTYKGSTVSLNLSETVLAYDSLFGRAPAYSFLDNDVVWYSYYESALLGNVAEAASETECVDLVRLVPQEEESGTVIFTCKLNSVSEFTCSAEVGSGRTGTTYTLKFVEGKRECRITASVKTNSGGLSF